MTSPHCSSVNLDANTNRERRTENRTPHSRSGIPRVGDADYIAGSFTDSLGFRKGSEDGSFGIEQSSRNRASILVGNQTEYGSIQALTVKKGETTSLPLLSFGRRIQADKGSLQWAADL